MLGLQRWSRRDFLKWSGLGLLGLVFPPSAASLPAAIQWASSLPAQTEEDSPRLGRVLEETVLVFKEPTFKADLVRIYWRDLVLPISGVTLGSGAPEYNRIWYRIGEEGYVHSGDIQPVRVITQPNGGTIPEGGRLAEVTVPYTDARRLPSELENSLIAYRMYYGTTHWIFSQKRDDLGKTWYELFDDKYKLFYYANATHLRLIPPEELTPISPEIPIEDKRLEVRLEDQVLIAYEWEKPVFMAKVASGGNFSTGNYSTPTGHYITNHKRYTRHMAAGDHAAPNSYDLPGVPWVTYFTPEGISFHGTYWHNDFGHPRSHGCVNLAPSAARWIFRWTLPTVPTGEVFAFKDYGTGVDIY
ncbi:MAG TPA: L,D-transpeptidase [Anaerolineaceae bacterium]|nr:L,D-transpeptidase [Anaerolineaceae bacterium]